MSLRGFFHLGVIYIAWGSTYLAMRVITGSLILFALAALCQEMEGFFQTSGSSLWWQFQVCHSD